MHCQLCRSSSLISPFSSLRPSITPPLIDTSLPLLIIVSSLAIPLIIKSSIRLVAGSGTGGSSFWKGGTGTKPLMDGFGWFGSGSGLTGLVNGFFGLVSGFSSYGLVRFRIILILTGLTVGSTSGSVPSFFQKNCF